MSPFKKGENSISDKVHEEATKVVQSYLRYYVLGPFIIHHIAYCMNNNQTILMSFAAAVLVTIAKPKVPSIYPLVLIFGFAWWMSFIEGQFRFIDDTQRYTIKDNEDARNAAMLHIFDPFGTPAEIYAQKSNSPWIMMQHQKFSRDTQANVTYITNDCYPLEDTLKDNMICRSLKSQGQKETTVREVIFMSIQANFRHYIVTGYFVLMCYWIWCAPQLVPELSGNVFKKIILSYAMGLVLMSVRFQIMMEMVRFFPYTKDLHIRDEGNELTCKIIMNPYTGLIATFLLWDYLHGVGTKKEAARLHTIKLEEQAKEQAAEAEKAKEREEQQAEEAETTKENKRLSAIEKVRVAAFKADQKRLEKEKKAAAVAEEKRCTLFLNTEAQILVDTEARDAEVKNELDAETEFTKKRKREQDDKTQEHLAKSRKLDLELKEQKLITAKKKNNQVPVVQGVAMEQDSDDDDEEMGYEDL